MGFFDDVENAVSDGVDAIGDGIDAVTGAASDAANAVGDAAGDILDAAKKAVQAIEGGASDFVDGISDVAHKVEHAVEKAIEDSAKEIAHVATGIADGVGDAAKFVGHETQVVVDALGDKAGAIASTVFGPTVAAAVHLANDIAHGDFGHAAADTGEIILDVVGNVAGIPNAGGYLRDGIDHVPDAIDAIGSAAKAVGHAVGDAANAAVDAAHTVVDTAVGVARDVASGDVIGAADKVVDAVPGGNTVVHAGLDVLNAVYTAAGDTTMALGKGVMDVSDAARDGVDAAVHAAGAVVDAIPGGKEVVHTALDLAGDVLSAADHVAFEVGKGAEAAGDAIGNGVVSATGAVFDTPVIGQLAVGDIGGAVDKAKEIAGDALDTVKDALRLDGGQHGDGSVDHATTALTSDVHPALDGLHDVVDSISDVAHKVEQAQVDAAEKSIEDLAKQIAHAPDYTPVIGQFLVGGEQQSHDLPLNLFEEKPNPDGDGKGGPHSDVAFGAEVHAADLVANGVQIQDGEPGIMNVGGHDALTTTADSFWAYGKLTGVDGVGSGSDISQGVKNLEDGANGGPPETDEPRHVTLDAFGTKLHAADLVAGSVPDQGRNLGSEHGIIIVGGEEKPNPDGDGKGGPHSDVAFGAEVHAADLVANGVQIQDGEPGIMNVGGHDALTTTADSFWAYGKLTGVDGVGSGSDVSQGVKNVEDGANGGPPETDEPRHVTPDAFGTKLHAADLVAGSVPDQGSNLGSEHGIIIVGGHDALTATAGSFWDQAAGVAQGANPDQTPGAGGNIGGLVQAILTAQPPIPNEPPLAHDGPSLLDMAHIAPLVGSDGHDGGIAGAHVDLGTAALHDLSHSASAFANQLHI